MSGGRKLLVTGATGYIGSRLVPRLLEAGHPVRVMVRDASRLAGRSWAARVEVAEGDVLQPNSLPSALSGIHTAYYLIHSMLCGQDFHRVDVHAAREFGFAAKQAGVKRIVYLGALGDPAAPLSPHLHSRQQTGEALRAGGVPVTEFRAAVVVGAGSLSFEMVRYLTEHIPLMICPRWVYTRIQPIAIRNCLDYLERALAQPMSEGAVIEIGGAEILTYGEMMTRYAQVRGLRRALLPVPVLTPRLSSYWVHLVTPISADIAQPLIEGVRNEVIVREHTARQLFPEVELLDYASAVQAALDQLDPRWIDRDEGERQGQGEDQALLFWRQGLILEHRKRTAAASPASVFRALSELGGKRGWLHMDWAWKLRGAIDRVLVGVGARRTQREGRALQSGDTLDFWTVAAVEQDRLLRLRAEMKLPGQAWLEFSIQGSAPQSTVLHQTAIYAPKGLLGIVYWHLLCPVHRWIFRGLLLSVVKRACTIEAHGLSHAGSPAAETTTT